MTPVVLPKLGESIVSATVVQWFKKVGESVAVDEPLLEVTTDKVNSEIPSPIAGVIQEILVKVDEEVEVGQTLVLIASYAEQAASASPVADDTPPPDDDLLSPAVMRLARSEGLDLPTLKNIKGTGEGGRVTKKDVEHYLKNKGTTSNCSATPTCAASKASEERVPLSGMRKAIAENMVRSFYEAPHASLVTEIDVTDVTKLIVEQKERFLSAHGVKLTITSFIVQALVKALQNYPMLNASLEKDTIICKRYINLGIAVNIDQGLIVPVIKNCQDRNLVSIAKSLAELASKARGSKLTPDEVKGSTITLTNFGMTGALIGTPIIHYPEVAIVGIGAVQKRVVVRDDDSLSIRSMVYLSITFDHRVVDGVYVCEFLADLKRQLESVSHSS